MANRPSLPGRVSLGSVFNPGEFTRKSAASSKRLDDTRGTLVAQTDAVQSSAGFFRAIATKAIN